MSTEDFTLPTIDPTLLVGVPLDAAPKPAQRADLPAVVMAGPNDPPAAETADEVVDRAEISNGTSLIKLSKSEQMVAQLTAAHKAMTYSMATTKEATATRAFRARCVALRTSVKEHCLMLRRPAITFGKEVIEAEKALTDKIIAIEAVSDGIIKADEKARKEAAEKKAAEEAARNKEIDDAIAEIAGCVETCMEQPSTFIAETIAWVDNTEVTEEDYGDRTGEVLATKISTRERLVRMQAAAAAAEAAAADAQRVADALKAQKDELDRRQADLDRREAIGTLIEAMRAMPFALVDATSVNLRAAMDTIKTIDEVRYGDRVAEARAVATQVLPELEALLEAALEEEAMPTPTASVDDAADDEEAAPVVTAPAPAPTPAPEAPAPAAPQYRGSGGGSYTPPRASAAPRKEFKPTDDQLIEVLALHYRVHESKVIEWLLGIDLIAASNRLVAVGDGADIPF